jgi:hypothetical protein
MTEESRFREQPPVDDPPANEQAAPNQSGERGKARRAFRAVLFLAGSAIFGGLAVALWDRKALTAMRRKEAEGDPPPEWQNDEEAD